MKKYKILIIIAIVFFIVFIAMFKISQRDSNRCSGEYSWNKTLQVCLKESEIQGIERQVLEYSLNYTTKEKGMTVKNISKSFCGGKQCFVISFDISGKERTVDVFLNSEFNSKNYCTPEQRGPGVYCIQVWEPVCGSNNKTYSNSCMACLNSNVEYYIEGECK